MPLDKTALGASELTETAYDAVAADDTAEGAEGEHPDRSSKAALD